MLREKITKEFVLSDDDKQTIKNNAQKIKNFLVVMDCDNCTEYINNGWGVHDFLIHVGEYLPFIKKEINYIYEGNVDILIDEIDSAIKNVKTYLTKDDFEDEDDLIDFITDIYNNNIKLARKIVEVCDEKSLSKLLNE